ncbi:uncharacterized protein N7458_011340 [Penicillium daleae]|uniref:Uncharacterized protein n=1 Tax=Penicillium daleae TaxID=63821 RepID=A0AAD6BS43_9EURO|nr:uncharacterized protein N7458_011340 [Penicillium daleae]KAJ5432184.1 hypothetical protein N7458_011340 [Penicillium daleae]
MSPRTSHARRGMNEDVFANMIQVKRIADTDDVRIMYQPWGKSSTVAEGGFADRDKWLLWTIILAALNPGTHRSQVWMHGVSTLSVATRYGSGGFGFDGVTMLFEGWDPLEERRKGDKLQGTECSADQLEAQLRGMTGTKSVEWSVVETLCLAMNVEDYRVMFRDDA